MTAPTISGTLAIGSELTVSSGTWDPPNFPTVQWQRCTPSGSCTDIPDQSVHYTPAGFDPGMVIQVVLTLTDEAGSASTTVVAGLIPGQPPSAAA